MVDTKLHELGELGVSGFGTRLAQQDGIEVDLARRRMLCYQARLGSAEGALDLQQVGDGGAEVRLDSRTWGNQP